MKTCIKCNLEQEDSEFLIINKLTQKRKNTCKKCKSLYDKEYRKRPEVYAKFRAQVKAKAPEYRQRNREFIYQYKLSHPCVDCGEADPAVLHFDHIKDKEYLISKLISDKSSLSKIKKEIEKCEVRCANCHMRKTARDYNYYTLSSL